MPRSGPRKVYKCSDEFKLTAVRLPVSSLRVPTFQNRYMSFQPP
jgi:hypothetical protein